MLRPSYSELMGIVNQEAETDNNKITSRYSIVIAAAKRARQIINGAPYDATGVATDKAVSIAISEMERGKIKIFPEGIVDGEDFVHGGLGQRGAAGVAFSADAVIQGEGMIDYEDDEELELLEDVSTARTDEGFGFRADEFEEPAFRADEEADYSDEYDYSEDNMDIQMEEEDDYN